MPQSAGPPPAGGPLPPGVAAACKAVGISPAQAGEYLDAGDVDAKLAALDLDERIRLKNGLALAGHLDSWRPVRRVPS